MTCDILEYPNLERFHDEYYRRNRPVVLRGLAGAQQSKVFDWSAGYFENVLGDKKVPVIETDTGFLSYERDVTQMPYREFVARSFGSGRRSNTRLYFKNSTKILPPGHDDSERIEVLAPYIQRSLMRNLWISGGGITVGLHFDHADNLNFQLRGEKVFMLFPPGVRGYYPMPMFSQKAHISRVFRDGPTPDFARFPRFDLAKGIRAELVAGDIIYVPAYWWHQVESLGDENVNLNFWWLPPAWKQILHWNQALRGYYQLFSRFLRHGGFAKAPSESAKVAQG